MMARVASLFCVAVFFACSASLPSGSDPDAGASCVLSMSLTWSSQGNRPMAGDRVRAEAAIDGGGGAAVYRWTVALRTPMVADVDVTPIASNPPNRVVEFTVAEAGSYELVLRGSQGDVDCVDSRTLLPVDPLVADTQSYLMRVVPDQQRVPVQTRVVQIPIGEPAVYRAVGLDGAATVSGTITDPLGAGVRAYLRATPRAVKMDPPIEGASDDNGQFDLHVLAAEAYDLLVVPKRADLAPVRVVLTSQSAISVGSGEEVTGQVVDPAGAPVVGARVSLRVDGVPSTVGITDASGTFSVRATLGGPTSVRVVPPDVTGLPELVITEADGLVAASDSPIAVSYAASVTLRTLTGRVVFSDGATLVPDARVLMASTVSAAATVAVAGQPVRWATGLVSRVLAADAAGAVTTVIPNGRYTMIVAPPGPVVGQVARQTTIDLTGATPNPEVYPLAPEASFEGVVHGADGAPLSGVRVSAVPRGLAAEVPNAFATAITTESGQYRVRVAAGVDYDVRFQVARAAHAGRFVRIASEPDGGVLSLPLTTLGPVMTLFGQVTATGVVSTAGMHVTLMCLDCAGLDANQPVASAVVTGSGAYSLVVPAPVAPM